MEHIISDAGRGVSHWEVEKVGRGHSEFDLSTRVDDDIARGDLGMARRRLGASLGSRGYDAVTLGKLGRHWLLSTETGPEVDSAIGVFLDRNGRKPEQIASQVMWKMRLERLEGYPEVVRARLAGLGLSECIVRPYPARPSPTAGEMGVIGRLSWVTILLIGIVSLVLGGITILKFMFSLIR